jgi:glutamine phosphoribosylpyrophosphate amidotransferase
MCGIVAYYADEPRAEHLDVFERLLTESRVRGLHAFGVAYDDGGSFEEPPSVRKYPELAGVQACLRELRSEPPRRLLAHTRYSTSGDYHDPVNNQPVALGCFALAFNGVVSMAPKAQMEQELGEAMISDNDAEMALRVMLRGEDLLAWLGARGGSFAGGVLSPMRFLVGRNEHRPLWLGMLDEAGSRPARFVASTRDIFRRAGFPAEPYSLRPHQFVDLQRLA